MFFTIDIENNGISKVIYNIHNKNCTEVPLLEGCAAKPQTHIHGQQAGPDLLPCKIGKWPYASYYCFSCFFCVK